MRYLEDCNLEFPKMEDTHMSVKISPSCSFLFFNLFMGMYLMAKPLLFIFLLQIMN